MNKNEIEIYKEVNRELRFAMTRLSLAIDCVLDAIMFEDTDIKRSASRIIRRTLEDVKDTVDVILEKINELEKALT